MIADGEEFLLEPPILRRVVIGKLLRVVVIAEAPWKTVMMSFAQPIEFIGKVRIGAVVASEEIAVRRKRRVEGVARAIGKEIAFFLQLRFVIREHLVVCVG